MWQLVPALALFADSLDAGQAAAPRPSFVPSTTKGKTLDKRLEQQAMLEPVLAEADEEEAAAAAAATAAAAAAPGGVNFAADGAPKPAWQR